VIRINLSVEPITPPDIWAALLFEGNDLLAFDLRHSRSLQYIQIHVPREATIILEEPVLLFELRIEMDGGVDGE
jgi:hypothetical protein